MDTGEKDSWSMDHILSTAEEVLSEHPLCDRCLGRLFARRGLDLSNEERGRAVKTLLAMKLHADFTDGKTSIEHIQRIAVNSGEPVARLYRRLTGESVEPRVCHICLGRLSDEYLDKVAREAASLLAGLQASSFLIGVKLDAEVARRELEVSLITKLASSESVKNELKREVGKKVSQITGLQPDFDKPDVVVIINVDRDFNYTLSTQVNPVLLKAVYLKKGRRISHVPWFTSNGARKYPESLQDFVRDSIASLFEAVDVKIHAAGREDVDARMLGTGRPVIIEILEPRFRSVDIGLLNQILDDQFIKVSVTGPASRRDIEAIKEGSRRRKKIYRVSVLTGKPVTMKDLEELSGFFRNRVVKQRTPLRILGRKKDRERIRRVYSVEAVAVTPRVFEALIHCDGGLYVKELVHCDNGRTTPCFSEVLGSTAYPLELDVIHVEDNGDK
ncbi:tRNA pseudouridine(54/55) synthase Pus10 [Desulfurococcus mucosus]|uniref:tRNA pseudouridine synthase Pus10 n=1 Tax=Desulfurococcus mucosus (strain ATCC 35584 / DSM 2162 / JCM 9187 / O7/1) TaxID=765177 RepID=E8RAE3_DESM0|nr:tRNA pseudouridine(54/55) synthase Pus10 [Desulfurococcus mucosus]ADV64353.1 THUMP domain-containing protein [Desulfurococcus mucosus DSM 2162]